MAELATAFELIVMDHPHTVLAATQGLLLPETWDDVLDLARRGHVTVPAFPIDMLMKSYMFCDALGAEPFMRGKFPGYVRFQDEGAPLAHAAVSGERSVDEAARGLNQLYRECIRMG